MRARLWRDAGSRLKNFKEKIMDILLIHCPDDYETPMKELDWYSPHNLLCLKTYVEQFGFKVKILDGQTMSADKIIEVIKKANAGMIGLSFTCISTQNLDRLTAAGKNSGAIIIVGGQAATPLARQLLANNMNIDGVVLYEGEEALLALAKGKPFNEIPNLAYRIKDGIYLPEINSIKHFSLADAPIPDRENINLLKYISLFQDNPLSYVFNYKRPTNAYTKRGCRKRAAGKPCSFCSRIDIVCNAYSPEKAWQEYSYLAELGFDYVVDFSDDYIFGNWLKKFAQLCYKKGTPGIKLRVYANPEDMTEENIKYLYDIGVVTCLLGIESGNEKIRKLNGKNFSNRKLLKAAESFGRYGMKIADAWVLGMIGETERSLSDTLRLSEQINDNCETEISYWNILTPLPGSLAWNMLMRDEQLNKKYSAEYHLDLTELEKEFVSRFTKVSYEHLQDFRKQMAGKSKLGSREFTKK